MGRRFGHGALPERVTSAFCCLSFGAHVSSASRAAVSLAMHGGVPEWLNGAVSKTVVRLRTEGSNPSPSAIRPREKRLPAGFGRSLSLIWRFEAFPFSTL